VESSLTQAKDFELRSVSYRKSMKIWAGKQYGDSRILRRLIVCVGWIGLGKERRQGLSLEGN
jgi:hypothetical protein